MRRQYRRGHRFLFRSRASSASTLLGVLVGARRDARSAWEPAIGNVTIEAVVIHGISLQIGPWIDLADPYGCPLFGNLRFGNTIAVFVRSNYPQTRELRTVIVCAGPSLHDRQPHDRQPPRDRDATKLLCAPSASPIANPLARRRR